MSAVSIFISNLKSWIIMNMHAHDSCGINLFYICEQKRFELATDRVNVKCFVLSITGITLLTCLVNPRWPLLLVRPSNQSGAGMQVSYSERRRPTQCTSINWGIYFLIFMCLEVFLSHIFELTTFQFTVAGTKIMYKRILGVAQLAPFRIISDPRIIGAPRGANCSRDLRGAISAPEGRVIFASFSWGFESVCFLSAPGR